MTTQELNEQLAGFDETMNDFGQKLDQILSKLQAMREISDEMLREVSEYVDNREDTSTEGDSQIEMMLDPSEPEEDATDAIDALFLSVEDK